MSFGNISLFYRFTMQIIEQTSSITSEIILEYLQTKFILEFMSLHPQIDLNIGAKYGLPRLAINPHYNHYLCVLPDSLHVHVHHVGQHIQ
jgi:hypothetical protein